MSVQDITADAVLLAVRDGYDDVFKLAEHFGVLHVSHTLRSALNELGNAGLITVDRDRGFLIEVKS